MMKFFDNKYDFFLFALIASLAGGVFGGALQLPRVATIVFAIPFFSVVARTRDRYFYYVLLFLLILFLWAAVSVLWTPNFSEGVKEVAYLPVHTLYFFEIVCFYRLSSNPTKILVEGWVMAFLLTGIIAVWELTTDNHLSLAKDQSDVHNIAGETYVGRHACATFFNYNSYVTYVSFSLPFLFFFALSKRNFLIRLTPIALSIIIMVFNASRGGLVVLLLVALITILWTLKRKTSIVFIFFTCLIIGFVLYKYFVDDSLLILYRVQNTDSMDDEPRMIIWKSAFKVCREYFFIGSGAGSMSAALQRVNSPFLATHSLFMELGMMYGFPLLFAFICFIASALKKCFYVSGDKKVIAFSIIFTLPFTTLINSGYILNTDTWAYFASLFVIVTQDHYLKRRRSSHILV